MIGVSDSTTPFQSTSTAPQPGTSDGGGWDDFINSVVRGVTTVITTARQPNQTGYGGTGQVLNGAKPTGGAGRGLVLILAVIFLLAEG